MKAGAVTLGRQRHPRSRTELAAGHADQWQGASKQSSRALEGTLPVWHNLQVINNRIDSEEDHYPGFNCAFNGNTLEPEGDVGVLFGNQAKIIGNFADNKFRLFAAGTNPESFGNGALNVVAL
jgi:hypothetical protein